MSFIGDIFSSDKGVGYTAPTAPIMTPNDLNKKNDEAYNQAQGVNADQSALAQALLAQSQGLGPNPAAAALQQATNQNQAMTAGTIAATKGINPALAARMAAQQGSQIQQQGANQAAQMQAQQQLAARQQLAGVYGQQANQALNQQQIQQGAISNLNQANVGNQGQASSAQSNIAAINAKKQGDIFTSLTSFGIPGGAGGPGPAGATGGGGGGASGGAGMASGGGAGSAMMVAQGGEIPVSGPKSNVGSALKAGGSVPGKAAVKGDSYKNDTVKALLSPGEVVIPKSVMESEDPAGESAKFVQAIMAKNRMK